MWSYEAPLAEMRFVIEEVLQAPGQWRQMPQFEELDAEMARQILEEAAKFASGVLAPLNGAADLEGCSWREGEVRTPQGFPAAYRAFVAGGWPALACDPAWGGQGLPQLLSMALTEMLASANHAWMMYPGLAHGAYECLKAHGTPELQQRYLPKIVSGEWLATMCLTESHAGSDLGLLRTRAEPLDTAAAASGGELRVTGSKIFISGGEHDLSDNIVHLVLCRLPGAPAGSRGLSLALVPKLLPDGRRNAVRCTGIEKKMGLKGSATCAMSFEGASGWLVGEPHRGLAAMFLMMNAARVQVAMQGLGHLEAATQNARRYAAERVQMRAPRRPEGAPAAPADPIAFHPAVRRTLLTLQARTEAQRMMAYRGAQLLDEAHHHPDPARRERAEALASVLTPVLKAFLTHHGHHGADAALQVWGGHGYVHDYGIEQSVRDSRVAMIYEGTNEIQAIDLLQRKVLDDGGRRFGLWLEEIGDEARRCEALAPLRAAAGALRQGLSGLRELAAALAAARETDAEAPLRAADDFLHAFGSLLEGWAWAATARAALRHEDRRHARRLEVARFGLEWLLPGIEHHLRLASVASRAELPWAD
ncbi:acyl-CoA dehydrogenase family protein [Caldimonas tepidiphila]|uniref:acyl-CoA dehydrogenase family protein n=1 Tax=Caldimonas tepidiphila TaxID=2315841 RepID=UPI000E5B38BC|nr:acyl-CoA dehydrogenase family protein [Caldimonas tepidiphila]